MPQQIQAAGARAMVRARVVALAAPHLSSPRDLLTWLDDLTPARYGLVVDLVLRVPARRTTPPAEVSWAKWSRDYPGATIGAACGVTDG